MFSLLFLIILIPLIITAFWFPFVVSIIILILYGIIEIVIFIPTFLKIKPAVELKLSPHEEKIFSNYYVFFRYPFGSTDFSRILAIIQLSAIILSPLFFFNGLMIPAIILVINYFIAGPVAVKLNPVHYIGEDIKKGNIKHSNEYEIIQVVQKKIMDFQKLEYKKTVD